MPKAIMVLSDGQTYAPVEGCRILLCPDSVTDQQIQQALTQFNTGNLSLIKNGVYRVATRFTDQSQQNQSSWSQQGAQQATVQGPMASIAPGNFILGFDPSLGTQQNQQQQSRQRRGYQQQRQHGQQRQQQPQQQRQQQQVTTIW